MRVISTAEVLSLMVLEPQGTPITASMRANGKMEISMAKESSLGPTDPSTTASTVTAKNTEEEHLPTPQEKPTWESGVTASKKEKEPSLTANQIQSNKEPGQMATTHPMNIDEPNNIHNHINC